MKAKRRMSWAQSLLRTGRGRGGAGTDEETPESGGGEERAPTRKRQLPGRDEKNGFFQEGRKGRERNRERGQGRTEQDTQHNRAPFESSGGKCAVSFCEFITDYFVPNYHPPFSLDSITHVLVLCLLFFLPRSSPSLPPCRGRAPCVRSTDYFVLHRTVVLLF